MLRSFLLAVSFFCCLAVWAGQPSVLDPLVHRLLARLAEKPELMNLDYLQYVIGRPANERTQRGRVNKQYYWYNGSGQLAYELNQTEVAPGQVVDSTFVDYFAGGPVSLAAVRAAFGEPVHNFFDYRSQATMLYRTGPHSTVAFHCPRNSFQVNEARVQYRGPALPSPSFADTAEARGRHLGTVSALSSAEQWQAAIPMLRQRLKEFPGDGEAHYQLARAYARSGHIQEAIRHYNAGLAAASDPGAGLSAPPGSGALAAVAQSLNGTAAPGAPGGDLRERCLKGLADIGVKPLAGPEVERRDGLRRDIRIIHKGQHMRAGGWEPQDEGGRTSDGARSSSAEDLKPAP